MMQQNEIGVVTVQVLNIRHRNDVYQEQFYRVLTEKNDGERQAALGLVVSERLLDIPRADVLLKVAELVVELEDKLADFDKNGLVLHKVDGLEQLTRMMKAEGVEIRNI